MGRLIPCGFLTAVAGLTFLGNSIAQEPILTSRLLQDEVQELPADNTAFFTAARQVSLQLDLLAAADEDLDQALVSVVNLRGETRDFAPDSSGRVMIKNVEEGPHAIVATGKKSHGATMVYFEPQSDADPDQGQPEADVMDLEPVAPTRITMVGIQPNDLRTYVDQVSQLSGDSDSVLRGVNIGPRFGYRVALRSDGTLLGRVYALIGYGTSGGLVTGKVVEGTRVSILRGGTKVGTAVADETGAFQVAGLSPGVYGCIAVGSAGYAALAFEAVQATDVVSRGNGKERFVSMIDPELVAPPLVDELPVILIPPALVPYVLEAIRQYYPDLWPMVDAEALLAGEPISVPFGGGFATSGAGYGGGGGGGGGYGGGGGGLGGIGALVGLGAIAAAASNGNGGGGVILPPIVASPSIP